MRTVLVDGIDLNLVSKCREELIPLLGSQQRDPLWWMVNLLDDILDAFNDVETVQPIEPISLDISTEGA